MSLGVSPLRLRQAEESTERAEQTASAGPAGQTVGPVTLLLLLLLLLLQKLLHKLLQKLLLLLLLLLLLQLSACPVADLLRLRAAEKLDR